MNPLRTAARQAVFDRELENRLQLTGRIVVDAGCNDGNWWDWYLSKDVELVVAFDRHEAPAQVPERVSYHRVDFEVERPEVEADVFFGLGLLYHLLDPLGFLAWARRCAPLVVLETAIVSGDEPVYRLVQEAPDAPTSGVRSHALIPTERALVESLRASGLEVRHLFSMADIGFPDGPMRCGVLCRRVAA